MGGLHTALWPRRSKQPLAESPSRGWTSVYLPLCVLMKKRSISLLYLLAQDIVEVWVQFYVVLLEIPIQLICAQDLCDANQLE